MGTAMKAQILPIFAAALAGGAIGTLVTLSMSRPATSLVADPDAAIHGRIVEGAGPAVDARFRELEAKLARLSMVKPDDRPRVQARQSSTDQATYTALEERLAALEKELAEAGPQQSQDLNDEASLLMATLRSRRNRVDPEESRSTILDGAKTEAEKLSAWAALRSEEEWGDSVVSEMIDIGVNSADADIRADVWRQADGRARNTLLVSPLLRALQSDPDDGVRSEAAETLENYLGEPGVRDALIYAAENDSSQDVRKEARGALN